MLKKKRKNIPCICRRWGQSCIACLPSGRWPHGKDAGPSFPLASLPHASQGCGPGLEARTEEQAGYELVLCAGSLCLASSSVSPWPAVSCSPFPVGLFCWYHLTHPAGVGGFFFFLMKQFQLLSQGRLIQTHPKHSRLSAFSRNSESTGSCQRDTFSLLHGNILFLVCITLSPRRQVTHVHGSLLPHPCAVFTWGRELHSASWGRNCPRARGTGLLSVSFPTRHPPRRLTDPPGGQGLMAVGPAFYHTFIFLSGHLF